MVNFVIIDIKKGRNCVKDLCMEATGCGALAAWVKVC